MAVTPADGQGPLAFVDDLDRPVLDAGDRHHLARVLRLRTGDPLNVSDGAGRWRPCRFGDLLEPTGPVEVLERPAPPITIAFAVMKGARPEWAVQKLTELGVDHIRPFTAARSVVRWDERRAEANLVRMTRVAREAAMQCRRVWLPEISPLATFAEVAALPAPASPIAAARRPRSRIRASWSGPKAAGIRPSARSRCRWSPSGRRCSGPRPRCWPRPCCWPQIGMVCDDA